MSLEKRIENILNTLDCEYYENEDCNGFVVDSYYYEKLFKSLVEKDDFTVDKYSNWIEVLDNDEEEMIIISFEEMEITAQMKHDTDYWEEMAIITRYW